MSDYQVGWICVNCDWFMVQNQRFCSRCNYTVYRPAMLSEMNERADKIEKTKEG